MESLCRKPKKKRSKNPGWNTENHQLKSENKEPSRQMEGPALSKLAKTGPKRAAADSI
jgi:hypothetical protein